MLNSQGISNMDVRKINKINIFRCIFNHDMVSHQEIASILNVSVPTVLQNVNELLSLGLVKKEGQFQSTGGRKARVIAPIADAKFAIGLDITQNHISLVLVNLAGRILANTRFVYPYSSDAAYYSRLGSAVSDFVSQTGAPRENILGVGVSIPGIVSNSGSTILYSHALNISDIPCAEFSGSIPYPCVFINDANAAGFAELRNLNDIHNAVYLSLSNSVGGAILLDDCLYWGENRRSGEFGHMAVIPDGKPCYCGKFGCLDAYCSAKELARRANGNLPAFFERLRAGDDLCKGVWAEYTRCLALAINNLRMIFDCEIILGGYVGAYLDDYLPSLQKTLASLNTFERDGSYLKTCSYKLEASALGAALQQIEKFIDNI